jgi:hypothetical protein
MIAAKVIQRKELAAVAESAAAACRSRPESPYFQRSNLAGVIWQVSADGSGVRFNLARYVLMKGIICK